MFRWPHWISFGNTLQPSKLWFLILNEARHPFSYQLRLEAAFGVWSARNTLKMDTSSESQFPTERRVPLRNVFLLRNMGVSVWYRMGSVRRFTRVSVVTNFRSVHVKWCHNRAQQRRFAGSIGTLSRIISGVIIAVKHKWRVDQSLMSLGCHTRCRFCPFNWVWHTQWMSVGEKKTRHRHVMVTHLSIVLPTVLNTRHTMMVFIDIGFLSCRTNDSAVCAIQSIHSSVFLCASH